MENKWVQIQDYYFDAGELWSFWKDRVDGQYALQVNFKNGHSVTLRSDSRNERDNWIVYVLDVMDRQLVGGPGPVFENAQQAVEAAIGAEHIAAHAWGVAAEFEE